MHFETYCRVKTIRLKKRGDNSYTERVINRFKLEYLYADHWHEYGVLETNQTAEDDYDFVRVIPLDKEVFTTAIKIIIDASMVSHQDVHGRLDVDCDVLKFR